MNAALLGSVAALAWGTHDFLARFPSRTLGAVNTAFGVTLTGLFVLAFWLVLSGEPLRIVWPSLWLTAATGVCYAVATMSLYAALAIGPLSVVAPIAGSYPPLAVLFALAAGERPSLLQWLVVAAVMAGVVAVAQRREGHAGDADAPTGATRIYVGLALVASLGFALAFTSGQAAVPIFGEAQSALLARVFSLLTVVLCYLHASVTWRMTSDTVPLIGAMGMLDVLALITVISAAAFPDAALATVTSSAFGAVTVVLARVLLKERISPLQFLGLLLIFGGVIALASR
jgi:drug/metabolite transporter (DMT)-like permease